MTYSVEKTLKENGEKISGPDKEAVEAALADAKKAMEGADPAIMNSARERLQTASHKLAEAMYKANAAGTPSDVAGTAPGGDGTGGGAKKDEGVIDAEYVDVDEKK
jgi:molecular chaperone DnaK